MSYCHFPHELRSVSPGGKGWVRRRLYQIAVVLSLCVTTYSQDSSAIREQTGPIVKLPLIAVDSKNHGVGGITKNDLRVVENKLEQKILSVEPDERPTDIVISIDASESFSRFLPSAIEGSKLIINN